MWKAETDPLHDNLFWRIVCGGKFCKHEIATKLTEKTAKDIVRVHNRAMRTAKEGK